jgi:predicted DNA-binding protein
VIFLEIKAKDSVNFTLRMPASQRFELERIASNEDRTVTNLINMILKKYIEEYKTVKK